MDRLDSDDVLRCDDRETGWRWYYALRDGEVRKHHEFHGFDGEVVSRTDVAEVVHLERVDVAEVSRVHLDVLTGENDG